MSDSFFNHSKIQVLKGVRADFAVEVLLTERLHKLGVSPFTAYINTVIDIVGKEVESSRTLFEETLEWVESEGLPNYVQGINDIFKRRFSFDPKDKVIGLDLLDFERIFTFAFDLRETPIYFEITNRFFVAGSKIKSRFRI